MIGLSVFSGTVSFSILGSEGLLGFSGSVESFLSESESEESDEEELDEELELELEDEDEHEEQ